MQEMGRKGGKKGGKKSKEARRIPHALSSGAKSLEKRQRLGG